MEFTKDRPLKVVTLCSGYDSQCLALNRLRERYPEFDYELIAWAEFDPESKSPLEKQPAVIAHNALFPQYADRNLGDMTKIDWTKVEDFDLLFYSTPCFVAGTLILTEDGYKPIEEIKVGDYVLTKSNVMHKVLNTFDNGIHQTCILNGYGFHQIHTTPNHKFWARRTYRPTLHIGRRLFTEPEYVEAKDLTRKHYLGFPVNNESVPFITEDVDFWYMVGMYIGDGWVTKRDNDIIIACNEKKLELLKNSLDRDKWKWTVQKGRTCNRFRFCSKDIKKIILDNFGTGSSEKRIPYNVVRMPEKQLRAFFNGYLDSDGCKPLENYYQFSTVNLNLAYSIQQIAAKLFHRPMSIQIVKTKPTTVIEGRVVNQKQWYLLRMKTTTDKQDQAFYEDGYIWYPFSSRIDASDERVYNIEVEEDHSYIANGCMVKNCQSISAAGLQHGFAEGSGTRSSIIWNVRDAVKVKRPKFLCLENVKAMVSKKFLPMFNLWQQELERFGYVNFAQVLNAKDYGVPQNRERIFLVSIYAEGLNALAGNVKYYFPKPFPLKRRLKDVLEVKVDEKYYLSDERLKEYMPQESGGGKINSSQDGIVVNKDDLSPCHTAGHGNCPKVIDK